MDQENFFLLLDLEDSAQDAAAIEQAIRSKQIQWSNERNHPKKGMKAKQSLEKLPQIRAVMLDPDRRAVEAQKCRALRQEAQKLAARDLDSDIAFLASPGYLLEQEVAELVKRFKARFTEPEVRARIKVPVLAAPPGVPEDTWSDLPVLDGSLIKQIESLLAMLGKQDLYDFLGPGARAWDRAALLDKAREAESRARKQEPKTAEVTAAQVVAGHCLSIFKEADGHTRYDNTLKQQGLRELDGKIELAGKAQGKLVAERLQELVRLAAEKGIGEEEAVRYIRRYAEMRGWPVEGTAAASKAALQPCGTCGTANGPEASYCLGCGASLTVVCFRCDTVNPTRNRACKQCGAQVGNVGRVRQMLQEARAAENAGDDEAAEEVLRRADELLEGYPETRQRLDALRAKRQARQAALQEAEGAFAARRLHAARELLEGVPPQDSRRADLSARVDEALRAAEAPYAEGCEELRRGRLDLAWRCFRQTLDTCTDHAGAAAKKQQCPPKPPKALTATATPAGIALAWEKSPSPGVDQYVLVRNERRTPRSVADGDRLTETPYSSYVDGGLAAGRVAYYAAFAQRDGVYSAEASAGPVVATAEVGGVQCRACGGSVLLRWQPPAGAAFVEVWRKAGDKPPARRGDGDLVPGAAAGALRDGGLKNGTPYGYRIVAAYTRPGGETAYSEGVCVVGVPHETPPPVDRLAVVRDGDGFRVSWVAPPSAGQVSLHVSPHKPPFERGDILEPEGLAGLGPRQEPLGPTAARVTLPPGQQRVYLIPVTTAGDEAVVGRVVPLVNLEDVTDLRASLAGPNLVLRWSWPGQCDTALVACHPGREPQGPKDPAASLARCTRLRYERDGGYVVPKPDGRVLHVRVFAMCQLPDGWAYAPGVDPGCKQRVPLETCRLGLELRKRWAFFGGGDCEARIVPSREVRVPELVIVVKEDGLPLTPEDGTTVATVPAGSLASPEEPIEVRFDASTFGRSWKARLFPTKESAAVGFEF